MLDRDQIKEEIIKYKDNLTPVIGDELFYVEDNNKQLSLQEFIVRQFERDFPEIAQRLSDEEKKMMYEGGYDGLTLLSHYYNVRGDYEERYIRYIESNRNRIMLHGVIKEYLNITKPKLIITTSSFSLIEKELGCMNPDNSFWYVTDDEDKRKYKDKIVPKDIIVYHLFGNAEVPMPDWVYDEKSLLNFIHCLHDNDSSPEGLTKYLKSERKLLLILGCKLPNWFFQFILYPLYEDMFSKGTRQGFWLKDLDDGNLVLKSFLDRINFLSMKDMESIMGDVNDVLKTRSESNEDKDYDIFISHDGQDLDLAIEIAEYLSNERFGLRVWIDRKRGYGEVEKGGDYWLRIEEGIHRSRFFMPIITSNYMNKWLLHKYQRGIEEFGLVKETNMAIAWYSNNKERFDDEMLGVYSIPIVLQQDCLVRGLEFYPEELFKNIQCYYYTKDRNDTFLRHPWENYRNNRR